MTGQRRVRIVVGGRLSERFDSAFEGLRLVRRAGKTELVGDVVDQTQLHGLLAHIRDLGLELHDVSLRSEAKQPPARRRPRTEEGHDDIRT
jgi:hypothetical protein